jgi:hypothetical protein
MIPRDQWKKEEGIVSIRAIDWGTINTYGVVGSSLLWNSSDSLSCSWGASGWLCESKKPNRIHVLHKRGKVLLLRKRRVPWELAGRSCSWYCGYAAWHWSSLLVRSTPSAAAAHCFWLRIQWLELSQAECEATRIAVVDRSAPASIASKPSILESYESVLLVHAGLLTSPPLWKKSFG